MCSVFVHYHKVEIDCWVFFGKKKKRKKKEENSWAAPVTCQEHLLGREEIKASDQKLCCQVGQFFFFFLSGGKGIKLVSY